MIQEAAAGPGPSWARPSFYRGWARAGWAAGQGGSGCPRAFPRNPEPPGKASPAPAQHLNSLHPPISLQALPLQGGSEQVPTGSQTLLPAHLGALDSELLQVNFEESFFNGFMKALVGGGWERRDAEPPPTERHRGIPKVRSASRGSNSCFGPGGGRAGPSEATGSPLRDRAREPVKDLDSANPAIATARAH